MNVHNNLYVLYANGVIGNAEVLRAYDQGIINVESCNAIMGQTPKYTLDAIIRHKTNEFSYLCSKQISAGIDVTLSDGSTKHFSLSDQDQININSAYNDIISGDTAIEYHADGEPFKVYSVDDMLRICSIARGKVKSETVYRNNLREWIKQLTDVEEIRKISYGVPIPEEYWTEGWRSIQEKIAAQYKQSSVGSDVVVMSEEQHSEEITEDKEQSKETIVSKAINAVTGKSRKKKAASEETTS